MPALSIRDTRPPQCVILMQSSINEVERFEPSQAKAEVLVLFFLPVNP
ncbi:putative Myosin-XV [Daphnia magna]|uniref:Putative Myosin-XV n=1 Tax=Daphnia magna TaxID=35525 RepID=A0A164G1C1_9CRUS|nr:putative Myosin-XV [Daphnia magna]